MNTNKVLASMALCMALCASSAFVGCAALQSELTPSTPAVTNAVTGVVTPPGPPVATAQLQSAATVAAAVVPEPWGTLIAAALNLLATGAAAYATFHARVAATAASAAITAAKTK